MADERVQGVRSADPKGSPRRRGIGVAGRVERPNSEPVDAWGDMAVDPRPPAGPEPRRTMAVPGFAVTHDPALERVGRRAAHAADAEPGLALMGSDLCLAYLGIRGLCLAA